MMTLFTRARAVRRLGMALLMVSALGGPGCACASPATAAVQAVGPNAAGSPDAGERRRALFATPLDADKEIILDGLQRTYPDLLPGNPPSASFGPYRYRFYPQTGLYAGVAFDGIYAMGGPFGNAPVRVLPRPANWRAMVTDASAGCWNLKLLFTEGVYLEVDWNTGAFSGQDLDNAEAHVHSFFEGQRAMQFNTLESWTGADGLTRGVTSSVWRLHTGPHEVTTFGRNYNELTMRVRTREGLTVTGSESHRPAFVDRRYGLQPGQQLTQTRAVRGFRNEMGATPADSRYTVIDRVDVLTTTVVAREMLTVPAGRFDTCRVVDTDSAVPGREVTTWVIHGVGLPVRRVVVDGGVVTRDHQARTVRVNSKGL